MAVRPTESLPEEARTAARAAAQPVLTGGEAPTAHQLSEEDPRRDALVQYLGYHDLSERDLTGAMAAMQAEHPDLEITDALRSRIAADADILHHGAAARRDRLENDAVQAIIGSRTFDSAAEATAAAEAAQAALARMRGAISGLLDTNPDASFSEVIQAAVAAANVPHLSRSDLAPEEDENEKFNRRRVELLHLLAASSPGDGTTDIILRGPRPDNPVGDIEGARERILATDDNQIDHLVRDALQDGSGPLTQENQRVATAYKIAALTELSFLENRFNQFSSEGRSPHYLTTDLVHGAFQYGTAAWDTLSEAAVEGYEAYQAARGDNDPEKSFVEWLGSDFLEDSGTALQAAGQTLGREAREEFAEAYRTIGMKHHAQMMTNIHELFIDGGYYWQVRNAGWKIPEDVLETLEEMDPEYHRLITADGEAFLYELADYAPENTGQIAMVMTYGSQGAGKPQMPVSKASFQAGHSLAQAIWPGYERSAAVVSRWRADGRIISHYDGQSPAPARESETDSPEIAMAATEADADDPTPDRTPPVPANRPSNDGPARRI